MIEQNTNSHQQPIHVQSRITTSGGSFSFLCTEVSTSVDDGRFEAFDEPLSTNRCLK
jgi:hypothetical protein